MGRNTVFANLLEASANSLLCTLLRSIHLLRALIGHRSFLQHTNSETDSIISFDLARIIDVFMRLLSTTLPILVRFDAFVLTVLSSSSSGSSRISFLASKPCGL